MRAIRQLEYTHQQRSRRDKMATYAVALKDGTVGTVSSIHEDIVGRIVTVDLHDENGMQIQVVGEVAEVLEEVAA